MGKIAARNRLGGGGGSLTGRLGVRKGGAVLDARQKIIQSNRTKTGDARDKLAQLAKTTDARSKLERIRGLKDGNLEVKQVGGITVTKKLDGKLSLSTKSRSESAGGADRKPDHTTQQIGTRLTKTVSSSGQVGLSTKSSRAEPGAGAGGLRSDARSRSEGRRQAPGSGGRAPVTGGSVLRGATGRMEKENVRRRDIDSLDDELMSTRVDPMILKKTVDNGRSRSMGQMRSDRDRSPLRSRSPIRARARGYDYDDPRANNNDDLRTARRQREADLHTAAELTHSAGVAGVSPLQGTKVVIQNLQTSVSQEDIEELFGDIGALKKAKMITPGHAEVVFINRVDAKKAVEIYHNRQLDGKPMRCQIVGLNNPVAPGGATMKLPAALNRKRDPEEYRAPIDIDTIHRALFLNKKNVGKKPLFTITMPKKSKDDDRW